MSDQLPIPFPNFPAPVFKTGEVAKDYTAEQLRAHRPDVADAIPRLYAAGVTYRMLAAALGVSNHTIRCVLMSAGVATQRAREGLALDMRHASQRLIERVHEVLDDDEQRARLPADKAAYAADQLAERADAITGNATEMIEVVVSDPGRDEFARLAMGLGGARARTMSAAEQAAQGGQAEPAAQIGPAGTVMEGEFQEGVQDV